VTATVFELLNAPTLQVTPASVLAGVQENVGVPENPLRALKLTVELPLPPGAIVKLVGDALSEKSAIAAVKVEMPDQIPYTPVDEDNACTSQ
jgi:hypothetical protein